MSKVPCSLPAVAVLFRVAACGDPMVKVEGHVRESSEPTTSRIQTWTAADTGDDAAMAPVPDARVDVTCPEGEPPMDQTSFQLDEEGYLNYAGISPTVDFDCSVTVRHPDFGAASAQVGKLCEQPHFLFRQTCHAIKFRAYLARSQPE